MPPTTIVAENAGYIVFKDKKVVVFYTNDLASTPSKPILFGEDEEAVKAVDGVGYIFRWTGDESVARKPFWPRT